MRFVMSKWLCAWLAFGLAASEVWAHDPFDHSSRMTVLDDRIEIVVTMGLDAARQFLPAAGFSEQEVARLTREGAQHAVTNSSAVDARLFEVRAGEELLAARSLDVLSGGLEILFTADYPRPAGPLQLRAVFFNGIEAMRHGPFVATDKAGNQLAGALLSRVNDSVQVPLPPVKPPAEIAATGVEPSPPAVGNAPRLVAPMAASDIPPAPALSPAPRPSFGEFLELGVEHILKGFDHLLFLGALLIGVRRLGPLLGIITCFTLAHSVTLALSALELASIPPRIVEPLIALSIMVVAIENLVRQEKTADRYWLAAGFGLIHGFGFGSVLRETGLAHSGASMAKPLFAFNSGVELGQFAVVAVVVPLLFAMRRWPDFARYGTPAVSTIVIAISGYWFLQRTLL